ncbi:Bikaverin cluster transcription factor bik5 [Colletotrichum tropicale]|nr:Bikaverin cluster transcription factor bik5 [Colletotrichum tropicale]
MPPPQHDPEEMEDTIVIAQQSDLGSGASAQTTAARSCLLCRRRKVKCDKKKPCDGCSKAGVECVYPMGRASRRQGTPDPELTNRLKRLEDVVRRLGSFIGEEGIQQALQTAAPPSPHGPQQSVSASDNNPSATPPPVSMEQDRYEKPQKIAASPETGRLIREEGKSRYISGSFWASLGVELGGEHDTTEDPGYDADFESLESHVLAHNFDSIFGNSTAQPVDICTLHPASGAYRWKMWSLYKRNVHPVVSLFHLGTLEQWFHESTEVAFGIPRNTELAMFCIYYGAVTSIDDEDCQSLFDMDRCHLLSRYRLGVEKCLVRAGFMDTDDRLVLEALCVFLIILRRHDARLSWKLSGLAIRLSQSVGIHRDGSALRLPFFEAEMRRRLAWQLCNIDAPAQEDYACDPSMLEMSSFDAGMPINLNDCDLTPDLLERPPERDGFTDSTFLRVHVEITRLWRYVFDSRRPRDRGEKSVESMTDTEKDEWLEQCHQRLHQGYLKCLSLSDPLQWVSALYVRCMLLELKLNVFKPLQNPAKFNTARRNELFLCSLECIEASYRLQHDRRSEKWAWFLKSYNQWHALAFVLHELRERRAGSSAGNAWRAVERAMASRWETPCENYRGGHQWNTILRMWEAARAENRKVMRSPHQDTETSMGGLRPSSAALSKISMSQTSLRAPAFTTASSDSANAMSLSGGTRCSGVDFQEYASSREMPSFPKQANFSMIDIEESPEDRYSTVFSDKTLL